MVTLTTPIYIDSAVNFDINESIANILNAACYNEGVYSLGQVCMYRVVDKGGVQPSKPPHSGYATGTLQELAIVIFLFTCMQLNYTLLGLIKTNPVTNVLSRVQTDDIQLVILSFL